MTRKVVQNQMLKRSKAQRLECLNAHILRCSDAQMFKCSPKDKSHVVRSTPTPRQAAGGKSHWLFILKFSSSPSSSSASLSQSSWSSSPLATCRGLPWWRWTWGSSCALAGTPSAEVRGRSSWKRSNENISSTEEGEKLLKQKLWKYIYLWGGGEAPETGAVKIYLLVMELFSS